MLYISGLRLEKTSLDLNTTRTAPELSSITLAALPGGGAVINNYNSQVLRLDSQGKVTQLIYSCERCDIEGLLILGDLLYIVHLNGTVLETGVSDGRSFDVYNIPDVSYVTHTGSWYSKPDRIPDKQTLLLCDFFRGEVFTFKPSTGQKQVRITGLRDPTSVSYYFYNNTVYYIVCEAGSQRINVGVHIYDKRWHQIRTIRRGGSDDEQGGPSLPQSAIVSDEDTIITSDRWNHRISEFSFNGTFLRHLLVSSDGIKEPQSMSYYYLHLWVVHGSYPPYRLYRYNLYG